MNAVFLLLAWGANPNSVNRSGDSPLLWLIKNKRGKSNLELVKLLIRFGANPTYQNQCDDGNCALHVLSTMRRVDLSLAFLLYKAAGPGGALIANAKGINPYNVRPSLSVHLPVTLRMSCL